MTCPPRSGRLGLSFPLFIHCQGKTKEQRGPLIAPLCLGNGVHGRSGRTPALPYPPTNEAIVSPALYQAYMNLLRFGGCGPMLKNYTGHSIREKVDILFRDSGDYLFRY